MSHPNRVPPGVPTGGQFAASAKAAADGIDLCDAFGAETEMVEKVCVECGEEPQDEHGMCASCLHNAYRSGWDPDDDDDDDDAPAGGGTDFSGIADEEVRADCVEYAGRYAPAPATLEHVIDWSQAVHKPVIDVQRGDRIHGDHVVTAVIEQDDAVFVHVDGQGDGTVNGARWFARGAEVACHRDRVDLSDPDWFEFEAARATRQAIEQDETALDAERRAEIERNVRRRLTRAIQPRNISPLHHDGPNAERRLAHGRAKVGDDVVFSSPMYGDEAYRVVGKRARVDVAGHDGTQVLWAETGEVEYVLQSVRTGASQFTSLGDVGWRRIPAPGDTGPAAQRQRLDR